MGTSMRYPVVFALMAIAITSTMDATGYTDFSALILAPLMAVFWFLEKFSKDQIGLKLGRPGDYGLAVLYPLVVVGAAVAIAAMAGEVQVADIDWPKAAKNMALIAVSTVIGVMITEEGFFRGALWASFKKGGLSNTQVLLWSSVAFGLWHLSWVTLAGGYELAPAFIPIFILNATLLGAVWGALRMLGFGRCDEPQPRGLERYCLRVLWRQQHAGCIGDSRRRPLRARDRDRRSGA
ncbi:MAG: CPBP family intramembrane metalloprotease [Proteobacteria bacterium]|nr:CPBP family intramembrane metalloprotease [Pseudomonadota bacterium]